MPGQLNIISMGAKDEIGMSDLLSEVAACDSVQVLPSEPDRRGIGDFMLKILNSAGVSALVRAIKRFFGSNSIELEYTDREGAVIQVKAIGRDVDPQAIVGFATGSISRTSSEEILDCSVDYPIELKLGIGMENS